MIRHLLAAALFFVAPSGFAEPTGGDWNQWQNDRKVAFVEGFISGSHWVAGNSIVPASFFPSEAIRTRAQTVWEQSTGEFQTALRNPKAPLAPQYTAGDMMLYAMFDGYKKNPLYERAIIDVPTKTIVEQLNQLYADSANQKVPVSGAIYLAKKMAKGTPKEDAQILLPYLRGDKPVPPGWIIPVPDPTGRNNRVIEFP